MKIVLFSLMLLVSLSGPARATVIDVGGSMIEIPDPRGYAAVTRKMTALFELQKHFVAPSNVEFVSFINAADLPMALRGEVPELERRFAVQTAKSLENRSVSAADFAELKRIIKTQNDEIVKKAEAALGQVIGQMNKNFSDEYNVDLAFSVTQMLPMPVHRDTDRSLAYTAFVSYTAKDEAGKQTPFVAVVTATFVHIKSKVLFLYCFAEEAGVDWCERMSGQWANAVIEANPADFQSSLNESLPASLSGMDWGQIGAKALAGGLIGLVIGLIAWLFKRGKPS